jgi:hypothetical protein
VFFEAGRDCSEMFELVEEALDKIAEAIEVRAESGDVHALGYRLDVGPGSAIGQALAEGVAVVGAISEQNLTGTNAIQHIGGATAVLSLAFAQLDGDSVAIGIDEGMDLGRQSSARAPLASGRREVLRGGVLRPPFFTFAAR